MNVVIEKQHISLLNEYVTPDEEKMFDSAPTITPTEPSQNLYFHLHSQSIFDFYYYY